MKYDSVIALSGGLDSTTALYHCRQQGMSPKPVFLKYPSRHNGREAVAAMLVAKAAGLDLTEIDLTDVFQGVQPAGDTRSALLLGSHDNVPEGHYEAESMRRTVVPGRNLIFASVLAAYAESHGLKTVVMGVHQGDHHIYPDCRPEFVARLVETVAASTEGRVRVHAPFMYMTKTDIVRIGLRLGVPYHLSRTCYSSASLACGKCGSCNERIAAFAANDRADPVKYQPAELSEVGGEAGTA